MGWQPIETVHGGLVLLTDGGYVCQGFKQGDRYLTGWDAGAITIRVELQPTHWMPLPEPPEAA